LRRAASVLFEILYVLGFKWACIQFPLLRMLINTTFAHPSHPCRTDEAENPSKVQVCARKSWNGQLPKMAVYSASGIIFPWLLLFRSAWTRLRMRKWIPSILEVRRIQFCARFCACACVLNFTLVINPSVSLWVRTYYMWTYIVLFGSK
jgi:hypothetical protein